MEHEVLVPFAAARVRQALTDTGLLRRCVPGLQTDADAGAGAGAAAVAAQRPPEAGTAGELSGRLRLRVAGTTITYRGMLRVVEKGEGEFAAEAEGTEARGKGRVKATMAVAVAEADGGTRLRFTGTAEAEGRLADMDPKAAVSSAHRLLDRFATALAAELNQVPAAIPAQEEPEAAAAPRRTMIGRSAEEVDHAPPRGRYAPVPAPETVRPADALRWAVPAAAALLASAVAVRRVLRRRR